MEYLEAILAYLAEHGIRMYRMASALAPYASHPELIQFHGQVEQCAEALAHVGRRARGAGVRLSTHPGQYTVLNSQDPDVVSAALAELEVHARLLDAMELPAEAVIVLHVGGGAGGKEAGLARFEAGFERLSEAPRRRLVLENDDRTYGLADVLGLAERTGCPVVWDVLHHHCHDPAGIPDREALELALRSWPEGVRPKVHFSSPRLDVTERKRKVGRRVQRTLALPDLRAHADLVDPIAFEGFLLHTAAGLELDVMLEAKAKDLALLRLRDQLRSRGLTL